MPPIDGNNLIDMSERKVENTSADITIPADEVRGRDIGSDGDKGRIIGGRLLRSGDKIFDLVDVVEEGSGVTSLYSGLNEEIVERVSHIAEKIAREIIPEIAERVIREEIEKLKKDDDYGR
ncbi:MAG: hypothetical protein QMD03_04715 [Syntrophales bacterium]|nr:hypothetical protein [Syntrophales bacterium]